jgi:hypothetical protein
LQFAHLDRASRRLVANEVKWGVHAVIIFMLRIVMVIIKPDPLTANSEPGHISQY